MKFILSTVPATVVNMEIVERISRAVNSIPPQYSYDIVAFSENGEMTLNVMALPENANPNNIVGAMGTILERIASWLTTTPVNIISLRPLNHQVATMSRSVLPAGFNPMNGGMFGGGHGFGQSAQFGFNGQMPPPYAGFNVPQPGGMYGGPTPPHQNPFTDYSNPPTPEYPRPMQDDNDDDDVNLSPYLQEQGFSNITTLALQMHPLAWVFSTVKNMEGENRKFYDGVFVDISVPSRGVVLAYGGMSVRVRGESWLWNSEVNTPKDKSDVEHILATIRKAVELALQREDVNLNHRVSLWHMIVSANESIDLCLLNMINLQVNDFKVEQAYEYDRWLNGVYFDCNYRDENCEEPYITAAYNGVCIDITEDGFFWSAEKDAESAATSTNHILTQLEALLLTDEDHEE